MGILLLIKHRFTSSVQPAGRGQSVRFSERALTPPCSTPTLSCSVLAPCSTVEAWRNSEGQRDTSDVYAVALVRDNWKAAEVLGRGGCSSDAQRLWKDGQLWAGLREQ